MGTHVENHCQYFVTRKNRFCKMTVKNGELFCGEHRTHDPDKCHGDHLRVVCPLDNNHSCYVHLLEKHMKKCNARIKNLPEYVVPDINRGKIVNSEASVKLTLSTVEDEYLVHLIDKINSIAKECLPEVDEEVYKHPVLEEEVCKSEYGQTTLKHLLQNASLVGHLERAGFLQSDTCFIEFGAGRGQLSYWIGKAMVCNCMHCLLLLIDRASHRHKFDKRHQNGGNVTIQRLKVDIGDLKLGNVSSVHHYKHAVAVSKHLCGVATDLALRCLTTGEIDNMLGIVMASCCYHKAEWTSYVGQEFLKEHGLRDTDFDLMCGVASWATCGIPECVHNSEDICKGYSSPNLDQINREEIGRKCKLLLDYGRLQYIQNYGFICKLVYYIDCAISPENLCLIAVRNKC